MQGAGARGSPGVGVAAGLPLEGRLPVPVAGFAHYGLVPVAGFLLKHTSPARIIEAVRQAAAGEPVVSPEALCQKGRAPEQWLHSVKGG